VTDAGSGNLYRDRPSPQFAPVTSRGTLKRATEKMLRRSRAYGELQRDALP